MKHLIPEFERMRLRYPEGFASSLVLPCLHRVQQERGYIADADIADLVDYLKVPRIQIEEVLAHYTMFRRAPVGRCELQVCHNVSCALRGAQALLGHLCERLALQPGQTRADGSITLSTVECLGACGGAPVLLVNQTLHENMTAQSVDALLAGLR